MKTGQSEQQMSEQTSDIRTQKHPRPLSPRDLVAVFFRHKWKMLIFFAAVVFLTAAATILSPEIYLSEAKLLLRLGRESVSLDPTVTTGPVIHVSQSRESEINSEIEILRGRDLVESVVDSIGVDRLFSKPDERPVSDSSARGLVRSIRKAIRAAMGWPAQALRRLDLLDETEKRDSVILKVMTNLYIGSRKDSSIINISYEDKSPALAREVIAELIDLYLEKHIAAHQTPGSYQFFSEQTGLIKRQLEKSQESLRKLKNEAGVTSLEQQQTFLLERIRLLEEQKDTTDTELAAAKAKVASLEEAVARMPETMILEETTGYPNIGADTMRAELFKLQIEEQKLLKNFTQDSRSVESVREEIARAKELLEKERDRTQVTRGINTSYQELRLALLTENANRISLEQQLERVQQQLSQARDKLRPLNDLEMDIARLTRDINTQEANLTKYSENLEQARIDHAMENQRISNISVIQDAILPIKAVRPKKVLNLALGLFVGVFGAALLAIAAELADHSIKTPRDIEEKLHLPNLGYVPKLRGLAAGAAAPGALGGISRRIGRLLGGKAAGPSGGAVPAKAADDYDNVKERLLQCLNGSVDAGYAIAVTSCRRREGVSTVAANLCRTLARQYGGDVLIIDANVGSPSIDRILAVEKSPGLCEFLKNGLGRGIVKQSNGTSVIPAGLADGKPADILNIDRFKQLLQVSRKRYRFTVVDAPALEQGAFVQRLAGLCDGTIMVVEAERLRWEIAQDAQRRLAACKIRTFGTILNKRRFHVPGLIYRTI